MPLDAAVERLLGVPGSRLQASGADRVSQRPAVSEATDRLRKGGGIGGCHQHAVLAITQVLARSASAGGDHGAARGHSLQRNEPPRLIPADREQQDVGVAVELCYVLGRESSEHRDPRLQAELADELGQDQLVARIPAAGEGQRRLLGQQLEAADRVLDAFVGMDPADVQEPPSPLTRRLAWREQRRDAGMGNRGIRQVQPERERCPSEEVAHEHVPSGGAVADDGRDPGQRVDQGSGGTELP
jgi:hypothetical protein